MPYLSIQQPGWPDLTTGVHGPEVTFGRAEDNDVVLTADEVSRHHAWITQQPNGFVLQDRGSLNGTYVNRQAVTEHVLADGDEIWFGSKCRLVYHDEAEAETAIQTSAESDSQLIRDIERIRADMNRVGHEIASIVTETRDDTPARPVQSTPTSRENLVAMGRAYRRMAALFRASNQVSRLIASNADLSTRLAAALDTAMDVLAADRGFIVLRDDKDGALRVHMAREMGKDLHEGSPSMTLAQRAADSGEPVLLRPGDTPESSDSIIAQAINSVMCVPLIVEGRILGAVYVDTRRRDHTFGEEDLELFASLAAQSALAIENVRLYDRMLAAERRRANLSRFLSPAIVEAVLREQTSIALGGSKQQVTTLFGDIRGFTRIAERMAPPELVELLNGHFTAMVEVIFQAQGTLDKFVGDEIMAVFGAPLTRPDDPERAIRCALAMLDANRILNDERARTGRARFDMGIGIATGEAVAGRIGSPQRMEFTVVGDRVNIAHRLCAMAGPRQVLICETTYEKVQFLVEAKPIGTVTVKGREKPLHAFEVSRMRPNHA